MFVGVALLSYFLNKESIIFKFSSPVEPPWDRQEEGKEENRVRSIPREYMGALLLCHIYQEDQNEGFDLSENWAGLTSGDELIFSIIELPHSCEER